MPVLPRVTVLVFTVSVVLICYAATILAHTFREFFPPELLTCLPIFVLALFTYCFRESFAKSLVMLLTSIVLLCVTVEGCLPIVSKPEEPFFPLVGLAFVEVFIFLPLTLALIMVQSAENNLSMRKTTIQ